MAKQTAMIAISESTNASITRMPSRVNHSNKQRVGGGQEHAREQRDMEQQVQSDGGAQHFGQIAGGDRDLAQHPQRVGDRARVSFAAGLRQVALADDPQARAQSLQQNRHQVRKHQHPQKLIAEARAAFQIGGPVARIHVADADQVGWPGEGKHAPPQRRLSGGDARMDLGQGSIDCG